jgi:hypothetical protein
MSRYEFSFVVTDVELSDEQRRRVGQAIALAGVSELGESGAVLPPGAVATAVPPRAQQLWWNRYWLGKPPVEVEIPPIVYGGGAE